MQIGSQGGRHADRQEVRQTDTQTHRQADRKIGREAGKLLALIIGNNTKYNRKQCEDCSRLHGIANGRTKNRTYMYVCLLRYSKHFNSKFHKFELILNSKQVHCI